jgi:hypothetical protein
MLEDVLISSSTIEEIHDPISEGRGDLLARGQHVQAPAVAQLHQLIVLSVSQGHACVSLLGAS